MDIYKHNHIKYAIIMAKITALCLLLMMITGTGFDGKSPLMVLITFIAPFVVWYYGLQAKKKELKGKLSYKEALKEAFRISLAYGVISPFVFLLFYLIYPTALPYVKNAYGMPDATDGMVIGIDMAAQFVASIVGGTIYGAIVALFVHTKGKKKK